MSIFPQFYGQNGVLSLLNSQHNNDDDDNNNNNNNNIVYCKKTDVSNTFSTRRAWQKYILQGFCCEKMKTCFLF